MKFEWDEDKNDTNIKKHGIDFRDVPAMFKYPMLTGIDVRKNYGEERWIEIGILESIIAVVVFTEKSNGVIRIISIRKATKYEREKYESTIKDKF